MEASQTQHVTRCPACERTIVEARRGQLSFGRPLLRLLHEDNPDLWGLWGQQSPWIYPYPWSHQPVPIPPYSFSTNPSTHTPSGGQPAHHHQ